jgi:hypothetical protein
MKKSKNAFLLFGMGDRRKLLYVSPGRLVDALTLEPVRTWKIATEQLDAAAYCVTLTTRQGKLVRIQEDAEAVWLKEGKECVALTRGRRVHLPEFAGHPHSALLRVLHAELLVNLMPCGPVPNLWVYPRPWYRDAAMMLMCLQQTDNLHLVEGWVNGLHKVWDRNNAGDPEADNFGQVLYMISLFNNRKHPLIGKVLASVPAYRRRGHICGRTDYAERPVYQTKWLKFGLQSLDLDDPYKIPRTADAYSSLFWMDYRDQHVPHPRFTAEAVRLYPYLGWAEAHFYNDAPPRLAAPANWSPLTWEGRGSEAEYWRLRPLVQLGALPVKCSTECLCTPHTWHAAEMFLYYMADTPVSQRSNV